MGNVPISCCRSKSSRDDGSNKRNTKKQPLNVSTSKNKSNKHNGNEETHPSSHILQHISEREPDDSETDPSSNPVDRPIFAARSCRLRSATSNSLNSNNHSEILTCNSQKRDRFETNNIQCNQDQGYRSKDSTSPECDQTLVDSFNKINNIDNESVNHKTRNMKDTLQFHDNHKTTVIPLNGANDKKLIQDLYQSNEFMDNEDREYNIMDSDNVKIRGPSLRTSSCSTIYCNGSTISQPNLKQTIKSVSLAIYFHIKNRTSDDSVEIFDETIHRLKMPKNSDLNEGDENIIGQEKFQLSDSEDEYDDIDEERNYTDENSVIGNGVMILDPNGLDLVKDDTMREPDQKTIYRFVKTLFKAAELSSEYAITTLVYLERLMTYAEMDLTPKTWRRMFLGAIVLSSKVWEDQAVWNVDYAQILEEISVEDINELERHFLGLIQFNMNVPSSVYAKYYFHLRTLAMVNGLSISHSLMTNKMARALEVSKVRLC